ncbi:hypothetical protein PHLGIDRAFT_17221 [Phlebiopsis gigantea 11061_1 CR5-6]|uniref:Uncharacterized protein n=1 Tax=Phlebiopsis gigantea (strain 11061_1 CR5-6) TaxID=745531 RepID=A0A0C3RYR4_PHLG1|nr:hypothetical protein PHLGIDRAFT_17221 [Phlebiopsis gigantea 11061_1 CR5-6]
MFVDMTVIPDDGSPHVLIVLPPASSYLPSPPLPPQTRLGARHDYLMARLIHAGYITPDEEELYRHKMDRALSAKLTDASKACEPQSASAISSALHEDAQDLLVGLLTTAAQRQGTVPTGRLINTPHISSFESPSLHVPLTPGSTAGYSVHTDHGRIDDSFYDNMPMLE